MYMFFNVCLCLQEAESAEEEEENQRAYHGNYSPIGHSFIIFHTLNLIISLM